MPTLTNDDTLKAYLGTGLVFPLELQGGKALTFSGAKLIRSSLLIILAWQTRSRFFLMEFGSRVEEFLSEPNDSTLEKALGYFIKEPLEKWEKRIEIVDEKTYTERVFPDKIIVRITYRIRNSAVEDSFVYPFYRTPKY